MSDWEIEDYARIVLIKALSHAGWPEGFHRRSDLIEHLHSAVLPALEEYDPRLSELTLNSLVENLFAALLAAGAMAGTSARYAGEYFAAVSPNIVEFKKRELSKSEINAMAERIGARRFFSDVFAGYRQDPDAEMADLDAFPAPPADNRVIRLEPKQIAAVRAPLDDLIQKVEADNGLPDLPDFRERILGQIKAGREMLLSGCIRAQLFYWVLLKGLGELVQKYGKKAIGVAAARLIELIVEQVFNA